MPRLWTDSIEAHRRAVRDATLDAAAALVAEHGLRAVTMSHIAERAGIGRATLYKYFPDVETILVAWHERRVASHLEQLRAARDEAADDGERLAAVLEAYAHLALQHEGSDLSALLHRSDHVGRAKEHVRELITELVSEGARAGRLRADVPAAELAAYCLHALEAARELRSKAAAKRLVAVVMEGLRATA